MNRRDYLTGTVSAGLVLGMAGCSGFADSAEPTPTPSESPTPTRSATGHSDIDALLQSARSELTAAFDEIHSLGLYRGGTLGLYPEQMDEYEFPKARSSVEDAEQAIDAAAEVADDGSEYEAMTSALRTVVSAARSGAKLYDLLRTCVIEAIRYGVFADRGSTKTAIDHIGVARNALSDLPPLRNELDTALTELEETSRRPAVDGFDRRKWQSISKTLASEIPAMSAAFEGFELLSQAVVTDYQGRVAIENDDPETAYDKFTTALARLEDARADISVALDRRIGFFSDRTDRYFCMAPKLEEAYEVHREAAVALGNGNEREAQERLDEGIRITRTAPQGCVTS